MKRSNHAIKNKQEEEEVTTKIMSRLQDAHIYVWNSFTSALNFVYAFNLSTSVINL